jgi:hypothetical protein
MDDAVHVQVQVIKLGEERQVRDDLVDAGVALREPAVELGHSHGWFVLVWLEKRKGRRKRRLRNTRRSLSLSSKGKGITLSSIGSEAYRDCDTFIVDSDIHIQHLSSDS